METNIAAPPTMMAVVHASQKRRLFLRTRRAFSNRGDAAQHRQIRVGANILEILQRCILRLLGPASTKPSIKPMPMPTPEMTMRFGSMGSQATKQGRALPVALHVAFLNVLGGFGLLLLPGQIVVGCLSQQRSWVSAEYCCSICGLASILARTSSIFFCTTALAAMVLWTSKSRFSIFVWMPLIRSFCCCRVAVCRKFRLLSIALVFTGRFSCSSCFAASWSRCCL